MSFAAVVDHVYRTGLDLDRWRSALGMISRHCQASSALLMIREKQSGHLDFRVEHGLSGYYRLPFNDQFRKDDLRLEDLLKHPIGSVRTDTMLADYRAYERSPAYRHLYRKLGTEHALGGFVHEDRQCSYAIRVFRSHHEGAFSTGEVGRFRRLVPHLGNAIGVSQSALREQLFARILEKIFNLPQMPIGVLTSDGTLLFGAPWVQARVMGDGDLVQRRASRLASKPGLDRRPGSEWTIKQPGEPTLTMMSVQLGLDSPFGGADQGVFLIFEASPVKPIARAGAPRFRLTPAEVRLVTALCDGDTLSQAAQRFGVGRETVKSQLRDVFQKMDVRRQADLVRRVLMEGGPKQLARDSASAR